MVNQSKAEGNQTADWALVAAAALFKHHTPCLPCADFCEESGTVQSDAAVIRRPQGKGPGTVTPATGAGSTGGEGKA